MKIFVIILLIWIVIVIPLLLDWICYHRLCVLQRRDFDIKEWGRHLKGYIPGAYHPYFKRRASSSDASFFWKLLFRRYTQKRDIVTVVIVSVLVLGSILFIQASSREEPEAKKHIGGNIKEFMERVKEQAPVVKTLPELKPLEIQTPRVWKKLKDEPVEKPVEFRKAAKPRLKQGKEAEGKKTAPIFQSDREKVEEEDFGLGPFRRPRV